MRGANRRLGARVRSWVWLVLAGLVLGVPLKAQLGAGKAVPLQGRVSDERGDPVAGARVELRRMPGNFAWSRGVLEGHPFSEPVAVAATDASGGYQLTAPRAGVWEVRVGAPGRVPMRLRPLPLVAQKVVREVVPTLLPPVVLREDVGARIEVRGLRGPPPRGAWVYAESAEHELWARAAEDGWRPAARLGRLDGQGRLTLPRARGERLRVTVPAAGRETGVSAVGEGDLRVTLSPGPLCPRWVEVRSRESGGPGGGPVPGAIVAVGRLAWPVGTTDQAGRIEVRGPLGAELPLFVLAEDGRRASGRLAIPRTCGRDAAAAGGAHGGTADPARSDVARLELAAVPTFAGRVVEAAGGRPLPGALVWPGHDPGTFVLTGPDGDFRLPVPSLERFWIQAQAPARVPRARWVTGQDLAAGRLADLPLDPAVALGGRVTDSRGAPLEAAQVTLRPDPASGDPPPFFTGGTAGRAASDAAGRFRLPGLRADGSYRVAATRSGYFPAERRVEGITGEVAPNVAGTSASRKGSGPRAAAAAVGPPEVLLRLVEAARLTGRVVAGKRAGATGVAGAVLWVTPAAAGRSGTPHRKPDAVADDEGRFVIGDLWPGEAVDLLADADGFLATEMEGLRPPLDRPLEVRLDPASSVEGRVVRRGDDTDAAPGTARNGGVEATVRLEPAGPPAGTAGVPRPRGARELTARTDAEGRFRFAEVAPGTVELRAVAPGLAPSPPAEVEVPADGSVEGVVLELRRGAALEGWITDRRGQPVDGARVRVGIVSVVSGEDGRYRLEGVEPGKRTVEVEHPDFNRLTRELEIDPGSTAADFELEGGWPVSGRVIDDGGRGIEGAAVEIVRRAAREPRRYRARSERDGSFAIPRAAEGTYSLTVGRPGFAARSGPRAVRVEGRGVEDLEVVLEAGTTVAGRLLGLAPEELPRVRVRAESADGLEIAGRVDPAGRYQVADLGPGAWQVTGELEGGSREAVVGFLVEPDERRVERDLEFGRGLRLSGVVRFGGAPLAGARVTLSGYDNATRRGVVSDAEGRFELADLPPGTYRLSVSHRRELVVDNQDLVLTADRDVVIEIRTAQIAGRVSSAAGEPLEDAMVLVRQRVGEGEGSLFTVATAPDGRFRLARLTAGVYELTIQKPGFAPWQRSLQLEPGDVADGLEAVLEPTRGLVLTVRLAAGGTPPQATVSAFDAEGRLVHGETLGLTAAGQGRVSALPPGSWRLLVSAPGGAPAWVDAKVPGDPVQVVLGPGGDVRIRVPALLEAGLSGGVTLTDARGRPFMAADGTGVLRTVWPLLAGVTTLDGVPAGSWTVTATGPRGRTWTAEVSVPQGGEVEVRLE